MSTRLIQDLHAGISRRDWSAVEAASNRLRDDVEETIRILAGTDISSLPNDYPLPRIAEASATAAEATVTALTEALEPFARAADNRAKLALGPDIDHWTLGHVDDLTLGDLRRARATLSQIRSEK